jgi:hypothetical protein
MRAVGSRKLEKVTKSRSSALSCSVSPAPRAWNPVTCERLLIGMRRKSPPVGHLSQRDSRTSICQFSDRRRRRCRAGPSATYYPNSEHRGGTIRNRNQHKSRNSLKPRMPTRPPLSETRNTDRSDDDVHHHAPHRAQELQEYWRIFNRNPTSRNSCRAFIVDAAKAPTKSL